jgi:hypothetical protein
MKYNVNQVHYFFSQKETPDLWNLSNMAKGMPIHLGKIKFH